MSPRLLLAGSLALAILAAALGLYWKGRIEGAAHERPRTEAARAEAAISKLETDGARETARRVEVVVRQREAAVAAVAQLTAKALTSEDALAPLDPDRAARLRVLDRQLCVTAPDLGGCAEDRDPG